VNSVNTRDDLVGARLLDFLDARTSWHRALWNPGLVLALKEIPEASDAVQAGILAEKSFGFAIASTLNTASLDCGVGSKADLKALGEALKLPLRSTGLNYHAVGQFTQDIERTYLSRWATDIANKPDLKPERIARAVASHLLDIGFNSDFLHRWWKYRLSYQHPRRPLHELIEEAHALASNAPNTYDILVAFDRVPDKKFGRPAGWVDSKTVVAWLATHEFTTSNVKQIGGILLQLSARDPQAAADAAVETIDNLVARARIATTSELHCLPSIWVAGESKPYPFARRTPGLNLGALIRENVVYTKSGPEDAVDAAFEMLAPLQTGSPIAAIAAGWAAIEAILGEPDDRGGAADRLATIVACSFPRAELTALSYVLARDDAVMRTALAGMTENIDRAMCVASAIITNQTLTLSKWSDRATLLRMRNVLADPAGALNDIREYVRFAFRRLYRQRNLVLHGGKTNAVALRACLRTAIPLIGAGMDRISHAHYVEKLPPLAMAARAQIALSTINSRIPVSCANLLG
jgi:hypothetical protein